MTAERSSARWVSGNVSGAEKADNSILRRAALSGSLMIGWLCRGLKHCRGHVRVGCLDSNHWGPALYPGHLRFITEDTNY